jgi:hypothetical protein
LSRLLFGLGEFGLLCTALALFPEHLSIARVFVALFPRFAQHLMHTRCRIHRKIESGQIHDSK